MAWSLRQDLGRLWQQEVNQGGSTCSCGSLEEPQARPPRSERSAPAPPQHPRLPPFPQERVSATVGRGRLGRVDIPGHPWTGAGNGPVRSLGCTLGSVCSPAALLPTLPCPVPCRGGLTLGACRGAHCLHALAEVGKERPHQETGVGGTLLRASGPALGQWPQPQPHTTPTTPAPPGALPHPLTWHWKKVMVLLASHCGLSRGPPASQVSPCPQLCNKSPFQPLGPSDCALFSREP